MVWNGEGNSWCKAQLGGNAMVWKSGKEGGGYEVTGHQGEVLMVWKKGGNV